MDAFYKEVASIEKEAINFIDESFKKLRSAQGAFELLQKFKHIRSRQAINKQMLMKFDNILERYEKEVSSCFNLSPLSCTGIRTSSIMLNNNCYVMLLQCEVSFLIFSFYGHVYLF